MFSSKTADPRVIFSILLTLSLFVQIYAFGQTKNLAFFLDHGISASPLLKDLQNQQASNAIDSLKIIAGYKPQVNAVSSSTYYPTIGGWGYDGAITNGVNFSQLVQVSKQFVSKANLSNQQRSITLLNQGLGLSQKTAKKELKKAITSQYITAYGAWQQWQFNLSLQSLLQKEESVLKHLTEKGGYKQTEYLTFLINLQQQSLLSSQQKNQYKTELLTLNYLCGIHDSSFFELTAPEIPSLPFAEVTQTLAYKQSILDSQKNKNLNQTIDFSYRPKLSIYADAGYISSFQTDAYKNFGLSGGVALTVPLYDGHQKKMQHDKINIAEKTRTLYKDYFATQYAQQITQQLQLLQANRDLIAEAQKQVNLIKQSMDVQKRLLETGDLHIADFILIIGNYLSAQNLITQTQTQQWQTINQINYWANDEP